ncbi:YchJ family metal-binding protein [Vibrio pacinii]|uniref:YchJ family metal-binding protein n=1 Tax=Vibrio pacinii TaxID=170674 RepID=UPI000A00DAD0|nr:YchJ family metal-binding protein [Vibrio pacinii]
MNSCPCGKPSAYEQCCGRVHNDITQAHTPETLMRARYCAHVKGLVDFVVNTYHPSCQAQAQRSEIAESIDSDWTRLEVICSEDGSHIDEGFVTFKAFFRQEGDEYCLQERSRFVRENGQWLYIDGTFPSESDTVRDIDARLNESISSIKLGRNDPCLCGSGKKFKKCCG